MKFLVDETPNFYDECPLSKEVWTDERWGGVCTLIKPITIDGFTEKCPKCGEVVTYAVGTGTIFHGAPESYEDWRIIKHDYCPKCGTKIEREGVEDERDS